MSFYDRIPDRFYVTSMEFLWLSRRCPPRETSPAARSEKKRLFLQARRVPNPLLHTQVGLYMGGFILTLLFTCLLISI